MAPQPQPYDRQSHMLHEANKLFGISSCVEASDYS